MKNILVIPNITYKKDLSKDSFVKVMNAIITHLSEIRSDLYFHIPLTSYCQELDFDNVAQYPIDLPSYPNAMRGHFDFNLWKDLVDWKNKDIDLIYSHLPEQTTQVVNLITNTTDIGEIPVIGYCHWMETKEFAPYDKTYLHYNIAGILEMDYCGFNTQTQIDNIIKEVSPRYSEKTIQELKEKMLPTYLGVYDKDIVKKENRNYEKVIVFNHRLSAYRNFDFFKETIEKLRETRQDFKVWASFGKVDSDYWIKTDLPELKDYYSYLNKCCVGVLPGNRWAVSAQDGLINGLPFIFERGSETKELFGDMETSYETQDELLTLLNRFLDDDTYRNKQARKAIKRATETGWKERIKFINEQIDKALLTNRPSTDKSERAKEMLTLVKSKHSIRKVDILKHFGWGVGIKFKPYRNYLLTNGCKNMIDEVFTIGEFGQMKKTYDTYKFIK
tara:strand:- start:4945 stop:6282 length:1338 start_codon:yes stop_codon:yes gene_type:complete